MRPVAGGAAMPGGKTPMGRNRFYGNSHGLPGLPKSQMPLGGHPRPRAPPLMPPPPQRLPQQMARSPQPLPQPITITQPDPMAGRRMEMLEQRLNATEQSNRALLDELMRLQQDLKMNVKRNEMGLVEEKEARTRLENTFRQSQNKNYEYEDRMRRCEEALKENRNAVQQMVSHTKSIERAISTSQQEQMERRGNSAQKLQEYKHEVMKMNQSKEQLERLCFSLRDEMRETASKVDNLTQEMTSLEGNVRMQGRLLEDNSKRVLTPAKPTPINTPVLPLPPPPRSDDKMSETARLAIEGKLIHMNTNIQDLTQRLNQEAKKREKVETEVNIRDVKLRDDTVNKLAVIENTLLEENKRRADKEKELQDKVEAQMKEAKLYGDSGTDSLKKHIDQHEEQTRNKLGEMANNISNLDSQMNEHRLQQEKVLAAEITERNNAIKAVEGKVDDVDHRARMGIAQLQAARREDSGRNQPSGPSLEEIQRMQADNADGIREQLAKDMGRMENRLGEVETKIKQQDDRLDNKLQASKAEDQEANSIMGDKMQQKIDSVIFSQERLKKQVDSLQNKVQDTPKSVANLKDDLNELETKLNKKVDQERKERVDGVKELRGDIDRIIGREEQNAASVPSLARLNQDVDETQTGMKKLAEAVHVVKTSLSERIKDEKKLREQEGTIVRRDVDRLNTKYNELREKIKTTTRATAVAS
ncbi:putative trichohyalin-like 3 [Homarus americanus]|uniref:Putative trichohyalin-like 3 n=1 Tax=Homarus americanus TaxID=6706 RepID=A0A8J5N4C9_HOMAM|nr:putative trichohyalin-like 3 [Homarus americanus]